MSGRRSFEASDYFTTVVDPTHQPSRFYWRCKRCDKEIKRNQLGAVSHVAKHVREVLKGGEAKGGGR